MNVFGSVKSIRLGNSLTIDYTYHISGAVKKAVVKDANGGEQYSEELFYEDCGDDASCEGQYNGNISRMVHELAAAPNQERDSRYIYDDMNRLVSAVDGKQDDFSEYFTYDAQGRITSQRRGAKRDGETGGEYTYYSKSNKLEKVATGIGGSAEKRVMSGDENFVYDSEGNLIEDKSKSLKISYDWRGMPVEFKRFSCKMEGVATVCDSTKLLLAYDGSGRRISKTRMKKTASDGDWYIDLVTHYTGIGTEIRDTYRNGELDKVKVVVNMPQGLGRYGVEDASDAYAGVSEESRAGYIPTTKFEWYLKNHLGSTMLVYGTQGVARTDVADVGVPKAAYDYRAFGEQVSIKEPAENITENFTGKELDDEIELNYFGARYLDPMLGLWISVDPARQFSSPYLYAGNGVNPVNGVDPDGNFVNVMKNGNNLIVYVPVCFTGNEEYKQPVINAVEKNLSGKFGKYTLTTQVVEVPYSERKNANMVALLDGDKRSEVTNYGSRESRAVIYMENAKDIYAAVHEFAHLLGFDDRYTEDEKGSTSADKGYGANLMGVDGWYGIKEEQIEEIFTGPGSRGNYIDE